jgi:hypothetical protein
MAHETARKTDPAGMGLDAAADRKMWLDRGAHDRLARAGLAEFAAVMNNAQGRCLRALRERENWYFAPEGQRSPDGLYLKKHSIRTWRTWLRAKLHLRTGASAARGEAHWAAALAGIGVPVMRVLAYGEHLFRDGRLQSFLLTEELRGYVELQQFLRRHFTADSRNEENGNLPRLIGHVAAIARRFHEAGFNHRDFYCCHFLIEDVGQVANLPDDNNGRVALRRAMANIRLIDLQRVQRRRWLRRRWIVKDLAQLAYSAPREVIGCRQRVAFLHAYFGVRKLRGRHRRLIAAVLAKQRRLERRHGESP